MKVIGVSGTTVAELHEDELCSMVDHESSVQDLKRFLADRIGYSRFRQRLFSAEIGELHDDMCLTPLSSVQLVVLNFCAPDEMAAEELLRKCQENRLCEIEQLLQKPQDPNERGANEYADVPPIHLAASEGHSEAVQLLLEAGADKDAALANGATAMLVAADKGHLELVRLLLEAGAEKEAQVDSGRTALYVAARKGHIEVVRLLLEAGADKDAVVFAATKNGHLEVVRWLLEAEADKDATTADGKTALFKAAKDGHLEVVWMLLEAEADIDAASQDGETALHIAAQNCHWEVVRLLLEEGADKDAAAGDGTTALFDAAENGHLKVVRLLLEAGADKDSTREDGLTALSIAAANGHLEVARVLLEAGGDKDAFCCDLAQPLQPCCILHCCRPSSFAKVIRSWSHFLGLERRQASVMCKVLTEKGSENMVVPCTDMNQRGTSFVRIVRILPESGANVL